MINSLGHAETGILADIDLVEHFLGTFVGEQQGSENSGQETERDRDDARVLQLQDRLAEAHDGLAVFVQYIFSGFLKGFGILDIQC